MTDTPSHLVALPRRLGDFRLWRWASLRGAGFPVSTLARLAAPEAARAAGEVIAAEDAERAAMESLLEILRGDFSASPHEVLVSVRRARKKVERRKLPAAADVTGIAEEELRAASAAAERVTAAREALARAFEEARASASDAIRDVAGDALFREALTWQNRTVLETGIAALLRRRESDGGSQQRQHEELVASYLQRYCAKNDTIGFFGPVGWARIASEGPPIAFSPGASLLAERHVYFEQWPIDALAEKLRRDLDLAPWLAPRRYPFVRLEGSLAVSAMSGRHELTPAQAALVSACDGRTLARDVAARLAGAGVFASEADVLSELAALAEKKLVAFDLEVPLSWMPERTLRAMLERISDETVRAAAIAPLEALVAARDAVERAAGDERALASALGDLDRTFTEVTGAPPTRHAGLMYAGRQVAFEDCRRDVDLAIGPAVLGAIEPALSLVLDSARWLTLETARLCRAALRTVYEDLAKRAERPVVPFSDVWLRAQRVFHGGGDRIIDRAVAALTTRWTSILGEHAPGVRRVELRADDLAPKVREAFAAEGPGWHGARTHSPDLMIASPTVEHVARGEYVVVLGEMHVGVNTLVSMLFAAQHPARAELERAFASDNEACFISPIPSKDWPRVTVRSALMGLPERGYYLETGVDPAPGDRERVLAMADLVVEEVDGRILVRGRDLEVEIVEFFGEVMANLTADAFRLVPRREHTPRITIDRVVVVRESWSVLPSEVPFAFETEPDARFVAAQRWARELGIPRYFFAKTPIEVKPTFVDLESPILVSAFAKIVRNAEGHAAGEAPIAITEMIPRADETWLTDAAGEHYTSELRIVAVDGRLPPA